MAANEVKVQKTLLNQDVALDSYLSILLDDIPSDAELDTEKALKLNKFSESETCFTQACDKK